MIGTIHEEVLFKARDLCLIAPFSRYTTPFGRRVADEFSDKGTPDIVLLNRPEWTGNQTSQPRNIARRMDIARDDARAENRQAFEAYPLNRFFFQPHHPRVTNPALCGAARCR